MYDVDVRDGRAIHALILNPVRIKVDTDAAAALLRITTSVNAFETTPAVVHPAFCVTLGTREGSSFFGNSRGVGVCHGALLSRWEKERMLGIETKIYINQGKTHGNKPSCRRREEVYCRCCMAPFAHREPGSLGTDSLRWHRRASKSVGNSSLREMAVRQEVTRSSVMTHVLRNHSSGPCDRDY